MLYSHLQLLQTVVTKTKEAFGIRAYVLYFDEVSDSYKF